MGVSGKRQKLDVDDKAVLSVDTFSEHNSFVSNLFGLS